MATPTVAVVHRVEKEDAKDKEIEKLKERIKILEEYIGVLQQSK